MTDSERNLISFNDSRWSLLAVDESAKTAFRAQEDGRTLLADIPSGTDWWRTPEKENDTAAALLLPLPIDRDFVASVSIKGKFVQQYDQAVMFLHMTHGNGKPRWVKAGVERDSDINWIGAVVTTDYSDWAISATSPSLPSSFFETNYVRFAIHRQGHKLGIRTMPIPGEHLPIYYRDVNGFFSVDGITSLRIGVSACQPSDKLESVTASFHDFSLDVRPS